MKVMSYRLVALFFCMSLLVGVIPAGAQSVGLPAEPVDQPDTARLEVGKVYDFRVESPHPAPQVWKRDYTFPGAAFLRLHFKGVDLADGDRLIVSSLDGVQSWEYTGRGVHGNGEFWSFAVDGAQVKVELLAPSGRSYGFRIVEVGYGTVPLEAALLVPEVVCGTDGREAIACHLDDPVIEASQSPVARLLFTVKRVQYLCTGELVQGQHDNTLITNAHCLDSQTEVNTLEARFNYQYTECGGGVLETYQSFVGDLWLKTNSERYNRRKPGTGLDYTLLTLKGNPEEIFGELVPTVASIITGDEINFIQHPGGRSKEIGYWEDFEHTVRCKIDTVAQTYGKSYPESQIGYGCDSEGGSSGSAITRASDGKVIGLHHYGGVIDCLNSATMMSLICDDAEELLTCDSE